MGEDITCLPVRAPWLLVVPFFCGHVGEIQPAFRFFNSESCLEEWSGLTAIRANSDLHSPCVESTLSRPFFPLLCAVRVGKHTRCRDPHFCCNRHARYAAVFLELGTNTLDVFHALFVAGGAISGSIFCILPPTSNGFYPPANSVILCGMSVHIFIHESSLSPGLPKQDIRPYHTVNLGTRATCYQSVSFHCSAESEETQTQPLIFYSQRLIILPHNVAFHWPYRLPSGEDIQGLCICSVSFRVDTMGRFC
jgi:hypothetical protein